MVQERREVGAHGGHGDEEGHVHDEVVVFAFGGGGREVGVGGCDGVHEEPVVGSPHIGIKKPGRRGGGGRFVGSRWTRVQGIFFSPKHIFFVPFWGSVPFLPCSFTKEDRKKIFRTSEMNE